jgi:hypothetical protein
MASKITSRVHHKASTARQEMPTWLHSSSRRGRRRSGCKIVFFAAQSRSAWSVSGARNVVDLRPNAECPAVWGRPSNPVVRSRGDDSTYGHNDDSKDDGGIRTSVPEKGSKEVRCRQSSQEQPSRDDPDGADARRALARRSRWLCPCTGRRVLLGSGGFRLGGGCHCASRPLPYELRSGGGSRNGCSNGGAAAAVVKVPSFPMVTTTAAPLRGPS